MKRIGVRAIGKTFLALFRIWRLEIINDELSSVWIINKSFPLFLFRDKYKLILYDIFMDSIKSTNLIKNCYEFIAFLFFQNFFCSFFSREMFQIQKKRIVNNVFFFKRFNVRTRPAKVKFAWFIPIYSISCIKSFA